MGMANSQCFVFCDSVSFMAGCNQTAVLLWINNSCDFMRCYCIREAVFQHVIWPESMNQQQNELLHIPLPPVLGLHFVLSLGPKLKGISRKKNKKSLEQKEGV